MQYSTHGSVKVVLDSPKGDSSWGVVARHLMQSFLKIGVPCSIVRTEGWDLLRWGPPELWNPAVSGFRSVVGFTLAEGEFLPTEARVQIEARCNECNVLVVPSHAALAAFFASDVFAPIHIVPLGVASEEFPFVERNFHLDPFTFLHYGVVQPRKGTDLLLKAFLQAFPAQDDVRLTIHHWTDWVEHLYQYQVQYDDPRIRFVHRVGATDQDILQLLTESHCLVHPSLSEGFGLTAFEALSTGLPVILSRYSAAVEFLSGYAFFVSMANSLVPAKEVFPDERLGYFRVPSVESLAERMREVYDRRVELLRIGREGSDYVQSMFSWETTCRRLVNCIIQGRQNRVAGSTTP